jgi:orotidine-5'-phosphate decarboxylase
LVVLGVEQTLQAQVTHLASLAQNNGMDGIVCSGWEVPSIKAQCGHDFLTVTPGIRLTSENTHDQARVLTPEQAMEFGSDYLVIGRAITQATNPDQVIQQILKKISKAY